MNTNKLNNFLFNISPISTLPESLQLKKCNTYYLVIQTAISIYASILSWKVNKDTNLLLKIFYAFMAFIFGIFYVYYHLIRYTL
jgi:hypothetical protein